MENEKGAPKLPHDGSDLASVLIAESFRGVVIVGTAIMEGAVERALAALFPGLASGKMFGTYQPLSTFSAKIDMARALKVIDGPFANALHDLRRLRNEAAHGSFRTPFLATKNSSSSDDRAWIYYRKFANHEQFSDVFTWADAVKETHPVNRDSLGLSVLLLYLAGRLDGFSTEFAGNSEIIERIPKMTISLNKVPPPETNSE